MGELVYDSPPAIEENVDQILEPAATPVAGDGTEVALVGDPPTFDDVEPLLGAYVDSRLGEIRYFWSDEEGFLLDAGEFVATSRPLIGDNAAAGNFIMLDGPGVGSTIKIETSADGEVHIVIPDGADRYVFVPLGPSTAAGPVTGATPEAA